MPLYVYYLMPKTEDHPLRICCFAPSLDAAIIHFQKSEEALRWIKPDFQYRLELMRHDLHEYIPPMTKYPAVSFPEVMTALFQTRAVYTNLFRAFLSRCCFYLLYPPTLEEWLETKLEVLPIENEAIFIFN